MDYRPKIAQKTDLRSVSLPDIKQNEDNSKAAKTAKSRLPGNTGANPPESKPMSHLKRAISTHHLRDDKTSHAAESSKVFTKKAKKGGNIKKEMAHALRANWLMKKLSPRKSAAQKPEIILGEAKISSGATSDVYYATIKNEANPGGFEAVCILLRDPADQIQFEPTTERNNMKFLRKVVGSSVPKVYHIDIEETTLAPRIVMERLAPIPNLNFNQRIELARNFIHVFQSLQKAEILHGDLKGVNIMCRPENPSSPVLIDLFGMQKLQNYRKIKKSDILIEAVAKFDLATGSFNPPDLFDELSQLRRFGKKLHQIVEKIQINKKKEESIEADYAKAQKLFIAIKKGVIQLAKRKEKCNAACAVYELLYGIESVPGIRKQGQVQMDLDLETIEKNIKSDEKIPGDIQSFLLINFGHNLV